MFTIRTISVAEKRSDSATYDSGNPGPEDRLAGAAMAEYLSSRPAEFRERLPFLDGELELEWTSGPEGVALASIYGPQSAYSMGILLAGADPEADKMMLDAWKANVLTPLFGADAGKLAAAPERPLFINLLFPAAAALGDALKLTAAALASAYFRSLAVAR